MNYKKSIILLSTTLLLSPSFLSTTSVSASEIDNKNYETIVKDKSLTLDNFETKYLNGDDEKNISEIDQLFLNSYKESQDLQIEKIETDEEAYAMLLQNPNNVVLNSEGLLEVDYTNMTIFESLSNSSKDTLKEFVERMNYLVANQVLSIDKDLIMTFVEEIKVEPTFSTRATSISIMSSLRSNAKTIKAVYNKAPFGSRHAVAGMVFAVRVKTGGPWDYKASLGTRTVYSVTDLGRTMSGESIGNFSYGYVGRSIFSAVTLKSAAGMYQIISKTSSTGYYKSYFDDPKDQAQIQSGINKYNSEH